METSKLKIVIPTKALLSGIFIGLAAIVSSNSPYPALMFSVGLILVVMLQTTLYTGVIGHTKLKNIRFILRTILFNFLGVSLVSLYASTYMDCSNFIELAIYKHNISISQCLFSSIMCGMLMCIATSLNKNKSLVLIIVGVLTFMSCKLDHSIANMFYLWFAPFDLQALINILTAIIGNAIGAKLIYFMLEGSINENSKTRKELNN